MSLSVQIIPKISLNWQFKIKNYARYFGLNIYPDIYDEKDIFRLFSVHNKTKQHEKYELFVHDPNNNTKLK